MIAPSPRATLALVLGFLLGLALMSSRPATAPQELRVRIEHRVTYTLPNIPDSVLGVGGWVRVEKVTGKLMCGPVDAWGCYWYDTRRMQIVVDGDHAREWLTLEHEKIHMALGDARLQHGVRVDSLDDIDDQIAEAIAKQRMLERLAQRTH